MYRVIIAIILSALVLSCGVDPNRVFTNSMNKYRNIRPTINIGDSKDPTIAKLETIQKSFIKYIPENRPMESAQLKNGKTVDVFYMRTDWYEDNLTTDDEYTPYVFVDGQLAAIGWDVLGGPKSKHDPQRVEAYRQQRAYEAYIRAMALVQMGGALQNAGQSMQNFATQQTANNFQRIHQAEQRINQSEQTQQLRNIHLDLQQLNRNLSR